MSDFIEKMKTQLDQDQPRWWIDWATGPETQRFVSNTMYKTAGEAQTELRNSVANRLFHRVLNASIGAGLMEQINE